MTNPVFNEQTARYRSYLEDFLTTECFCKDDEPQKILFDSMRYSLLAGGKRLRPIFLFEFCRMCGGNWEDAVSFAAALEMVHTYSLIHDDLPCMDNDDYRRGRLTNHKVYGEATAVLAGDALLTAAFQYIAKAPFSAEIRIQAVDILSNCAGEFGMVGGQVLDMMCEHNTCNEQDILNIQNRKTGALIRAACMLGVLAGNGDTTQLTAASSFASDIGLAFQIRDDMLDVIGSREELGKAVGTDSQKITFVQLRGLEECAKLIEALTQSAVENLSVFTDTNYIVWLARELTSRTK